MTIRGKFEKDDNFTTIYYNNVIYTVARVTGDWNSKKVGDVLENGKVLTQEKYNEWAAACERSATFELV